MRNKFIVTHTWYFHVLNVVTYKMNVEQIAATPTPPHNPTQPPKKTKKPKTNKQTKYCTSNLNVIADYTDHKNKSINLYGIYIYLLNNKKY